MTSDVTLTGVAQQTQKTQNQSAKLATDFNQFLNLLTTQLQNQDPLSPMDSTEFTNQLVQFSQVEQQINMNQKLNDMLSTQVASMSSMALGYVGLDVSYQSADMNYDGGTPVKVTYALNKDATTSKVNIVDDAGNLVYSGPGETSTGKHEFVWDGTRTGGGKAAPGTYSVQISAFDADKNVIDAPTVVTGRVHGIETQNGIIHLLVGDRAVPVVKVLNATLPETEVASTIN